MKPEMHYWRVAMWLPKEAFPGRNYGKNLCVGVGATDLPAAAKEVLKLYPLAEINAITRQGSIANWPGGEPSAEWIARQPLPGDAEDRI